MKGLKRFSALLLALVVSISILPAAAFAANTVRQDALHALAGYLQTAGYVDGTMPRIAASDCWYMEGGASLSGTWYKAANGTTYYGDNYPRGGNYVAPALTGSNMENALRISIALYGDGGLLTIMIRDLQSGSNLNNCSYYSSRTGQTYYLGSSNNSTTNSRWWQSTNYTDNNAPNEAFQWWYNTATGTWFFYDQWGNIVWSSTRGWHYYYSDTNGRYYYDQYGRKQYGIYTGSNIVNVSVGNVGNNYGYSSNNIGTTNYGYGQNWRINSDGSMVVNNTTYYYDYSRDSWYYISNGSRTYVYNPLQNLSDYDLLRGLIEFKSNGDLVIAGTTYYTDGYGDGWRAADGTYFSLSDLRQYLEALGNAQNGYSYNYNNYNYNYNFSGEVQYYRYDAGSQRYYYFREDGTRFESNSQGRARYYRDNTGYYFYDREGTKAYVAPLTATAIAGTVSWYSNGSYNNGYYYYGPTGRRLTSHEVDVYPYYWDTSRRIYYKYDQSGNRVDVNSTNTTGGNTNGWYNGYNMFGSSVINVYNESTEATARTLAEIAFRYAYNEASQTKQAAVMWAVLNSNGSAQLSASVTQRFNPQGTSQPSWVNGDLLDSHSRSLLMLARDVLFRYKYEQDTGIRDTTNVTSCQSGRVLPGNYTYILRQSGGLYFGSNPNVSTSNCWNWSLRSPYAT